MNEKAEDEWIAPLRSAQRAETEHPCQVSLSVPPIEQDNSRIQSFVFSNSAKRASQLEGRGVS